MVEMITANNSCSTSRQVDFDLHGLVSIRLLNASPKDVAIVRKQLGPIESRLAKEPDITVRFTDRLELNGEIRYLNLDNAYTDDEFLVLRGKHKSRVRVQIPFDQIGGPCEIVCERPIPAVPLLLSIINVTALSKGVLPLHASGFIYNNTGVLTTGWSKGGKTETLLAFMDRGAKYVGDEWIYLSGDDPTMHGIPEPIRIWDWQFGELPQFRAHVSRIDRLRMRLLKAATRSMEWASMDQSPRGFSGRAMCKFTYVLNQQRYVQIHPQKLFGKKEYVQQAKPEKIFFVASHESADVTVRPIEPEEIAERMVFSLEEERSDLLACYRRYRFAFPNRVNPLLEKTEEIQRQQLLNILKNKETYALYHPYPVSIPALFDAMCPFI
jgi:hypothetical protein